MSESSIHYPAPFGAPRVASRSYNVLLVEDNAGDAQLAREAWAEIQPECRVQVTQNGEEAMAFLRRRPPHAGAPRPDLVILDLNLPRKDGRELLGEIKRDPALACLPVIVFTTSNAPDDVRRCYELHANCYVIKPVGLDDLYRVVQSIHDFWFGIARLSNS
jgi:two-component system, chemotaxis family, response regulator Rcp1